jgi:hypothetical protein
MAAAAMVQAVKVYAAQPYSVMWQLVATALLLMLTFCCAL